MKSLWFIVPCFGREQLTAICLRQLRRTCDALADHDIEATAVIIADDANLQTAGELGFGTVTRDNRFLSKRFNDGIMFACDERYQGTPADYIVPFGSDDWIDHRILTDLPPANTAVGFQHISFVREDGGEITSRFLRTAGGSGIRIYPRQLMEPLGYRPADEDRYRACDTSILVNLRRLHGDRMRVEHRHLHERQIVDWKSAGDQLTSYEELRRHRGVSAADPFVELAGIYPDEALEEMRAHYAGARELVAA